MPGDAANPPSTARRMLFVATICAGSFLLFLVQPMIARMALPRLGGAPAVWNSAMLVYQALLLGGYAYAHWLGRFAPRRQSYIHLALFAVAALMLPIGLNTGGWATELDPVIGVPLLLLISIGPLFFIVSAQAPLIQRWFAQSGQGDPYPLYAASNFGSFAGLIAYPFLVEPLMPVVEQRWLWSGGYLALIGLVFLCARALPVRTASAATEKEGVAPTWRQWGRWVLLAAVPSGLMLSTTLHLTTDIVAMPLLWVVPLGLYLLSFSIAFAARQSLAWLLSLLAPFFLIIGASIVFVDTTSWPISATLFSLALLLVISVALHSRLFADRPHPDRLTGFYLAMSVGGVLGGVLCALIAPVIFDWGYEHPLLLLAAALLLPRRKIDAVEETLPFNATAARWVPILALALSMVAAALVIDPVPQWLLIACVGLIFAVVLRTIGHGLAFAVSLAALMLSMGGWNRLDLSAQPGVLTRSYFGIYTVRDRGQSRDLVHGTTLHGVQNRGSAMREMMSTTYYTPLSGVGLALEAAPKLFGENARVGVVGLGTGTLACYALPGQRWTYYEIDPVIVDIARDEGRFTYLKRCLPDARMVLGDARIMLEREPAASADILVVDAFSSDAIPMHLMTAEAFASYRRHVTPNGLVMVHTSNRYLDLERVVAAAARNGWHARMREYRPTKTDQAFNYTASSWIAMSPSRETIDTLLAGQPRDRWRPLAPTRGLAPWTDDHASILSIIRLKNQ